jgi:hypothetical protein
VWCRDMLNHVADLRGAFSECARVLRRGGRMVIFHTFATDLLEPREAERLYAPLAVVAESMEQGALEHALSAGGLHLLERDVVASEWREFGEETGERRTSAQLLRIARLRRRPDQLRAELGDEAYEIELADCLWGVYQMLGKLRPEIWIAERPA